MSDKLTEATDEEVEAAAAALTDLVRMANRWASFPTDDDVDMAEAAYVTYLYEHSDPLADVVDTRHAAFKVALEAVKREDRHEHEWVDARNRIVESGEWCPGCNAIREAT